MYLHEGIVTQQQRLGFVWLLGVIQVLSQNYRKLIQAFQAQN